MDKKEYDKLKELEFLKESETLDTILERMKNLTENDFEDL